MGATEERKTIRPPVDPDQPRYRRHQQRPGDHALVAPFFCLLGLTKTGVGNDFVDHSSKLKFDNIGYFSRNWKRMRYDKFKAQGMHIGSKIAESILQLRRLWTAVLTVDFAQYARMAA